MFGIKIIFASKYKPPEVGIWQEVEVKKQTKHP